MKNLNAHFTDREFKKIMKVKDLHGGNWHDFLLYLIERTEVENNGNN